MARMKFLSAALTAAFLLAIVSVARAAIKTEAVTYQEGQAKAHSLIVYDDSVSGKRPGVLVVPEWWGLNDYPRMRAKMLAQMGYAAMAVDIYGDGKVTADPKQAGRGPTRWRQATARSCALVSRPHSPGSKAIRTWTQARPQRSDTASAARLCWNSRAAAPRLTASSVFMATTTPRIRPNLAG